MAYTTINKSTDYFNTKLYTGTGSSQAITGVGFQPDLLWLKPRSTTGYHRLFDAVRGAGYQLYTNTTSGSGLDTNQMSAFNSDGFTLGNETGSNANGTTFASWNWKANGQGSANTDGSINTTYTSVNTTSGFSINQYTGTGATATVGHGLGVAPDFMIIKKYSASGTQWTIYHKQLGPTKHILFTTGAETTQANYWNDTAPTNLVWTMGNQSEINGSGTTNICYAFAEKKGYSKFGSYVGNGNANGAFVYTGFKPAFILQKRTNSASTGWGMFDNTRSPTNVSQNMILANSNAVEDTSAAGAIDFLSNGFKFRTADGWFNGGGDPHIYMAFAEAPLVGSNGVTAKAR